MAPGDKVISVELTINFHFGLFAILPYLFSQH